MPLHLKYVFTSTPNPIRASIGGANPNIIDLRVMVSNPDLDPRLLSTISITIPVGSNAAGTLSASESLPSPQYDAGSGWTAAATASTVILTPPASGVLNSFLFTLPGIQINDKPGVVPLTVEELSPTAPKRIDGATYTLTKYEDDFPVTNFYATPAALDDRDRAVTLKWECSDQGQHFVYRVHSDSWQSNECLNDGRCLTCADGGRGVLSPKLTGTTTFALDVISAVGGPRSIYKTLTTTVRVSVPSFSGSEKQTALFSGRAARLHWIALDAAYCTVLLDGEVIDERAPTDTYEQGYLVTALLGLTGQHQTGQHQLTVVAHAQTGRATAEHAFPTLNITPPVSIAGGREPSNIAFTPDDKLAFVAVSPNVTVIDVARRKAVEPVIVGDRFPMLGVAVTPDGRFALVTSTSQRAVLIVDVATRRVVHSVKVGKVGDGLGSVAITPDGTLAFVSMGWEVLVMNVATRQVVNTIQFRSGVLGGPVITADGRYCLVVAYHDSANILPAMGSFCLSVINIATRQIVGEPIKFANRPRCVAVTPDGKLAFVGTGGGLQVMDVATRQIVGDPIIVARGVTRIAITPDGKLAFASASGIGVSVIEVASRRFIGSIDGVQPGRVAVTPDGHHLFVGSYDVVFIV